MNAVLWSAVAALLVGLGGSSVGRTMPSQAGTHLSPKIPAPIEAQYRAIRDAKDWRNPSLAVTADGIAVKSLSLRDGRRPTSAIELRDLLISLPVADWPYGRVVMASDPSIRRADRSDDAAIRRNHALAEQVLKQLDIRAEWWPSAPESRHDDLTFGPPRGWQ